MLSSMLYRLVSQKNVGENTEKSEHEKHFLNWKSKKAEISCLQKDDLVILVILFFRNRIFSKTLR